MKNIIFDLDGTLIDSKPRLYYLFQYLVPQCNLSYEEYWDFKQRKVSNEAILLNIFGFDTAATHIFMNNWMKYIESPEFLAYDKNLPGLTQALNRLSKQAKLHTCTARQSREAAVDQLDRLGLLSYFASVMVTEQKKSKDELIASTVLDLSSGDWMIGDTGKDIQAGHALGIKTCAVLSGFLSEKSLIPYKPDVILPSVAYFQLT